MSDDTYLKLLERRMQVLLDAGISPNKAYELASEQAYANLHDHYAERADALKERMKEEGRWPPK